MRNTRWISCSAGNYEDFAIKGGGALPRLFLQHRNAFFIRLDHRLIAAVSRVSIGAFEYRGFYAHLHKIFRCADGDQVHDAHVYYRRSGRDGMGQALEKHGSVADHTAVVYNVIAHLEQPLAGGVARRAGGGGFGAAEDVL